LSDIDPELVEQYANQLAESLDKTRVEVRDRYWSDKIVVIDGYRFVNCRFERCKLVFKWPSFEFEGCTFDEVDIVPKRKADKAADALPPPT